MLHVFEFATHAGLLRWSHMIAIYRRHTIMLPRFKIYCNSRRNELTRGLNHRFFEIFFAREQLWQIAISILVAPSASWWLFTIFRRTESSWCWLEPDHCCMIVVLFGFVFHQLPWCLGFVMVLFHHARKWWYMFYLSDYLIWFWAPM